MAESRIAVMEGVREHTERYPVELWFNEDSRVVVRCYNEGRNNITEVDLLDIIEWARSTGLGCIAQRIDDLTKEIKG